MPTLDTKLTETVARSAAKCPAPAPSLVQDPDDPSKTKEKSTYLIYWCASGDGFGVRVSSSGDRAWIMERRVNGKTVRRTLGKVVGRGAISANAARATALDVSSELQRGVDRAADERQERHAAKEAKAQESLTLARALEEYVEKKRRHKDGLALKDRTKADYLAMIEPGGTKASGEPTQNGALYDLADEPIARITADDMRKLYAKLQTRGARQQVYAFQVLRAVLNWHGVRVPGNPLSKDVPGRERIVLPQPRGNPSPIPPERLGAWWRAACAASGDKSQSRREAADYYRFQLLTGCRSVEILGDDFGNSPIHVRDVDLVSGRIVVRDTKNRKDHTLLLSSQALRIAARRAEGKRRTAPLFELVDGRATLNAIGAAAGVEISGHDLRATFASVAEDVVSAYTLKRMLNHAESGDVTGAHYVGKSEAQLRAGWQAVADAIEQLAKLPEESGGSRDDATQRSKTGA